VGWVTCWASLGPVGKVITWVRGSRDLLALPGLQRVILFAVVVGVEELLEPLDELKVVLELALDQFLHGHDLPGGGERGRTTASWVGQRLMWRKTYARI